MRTLNINLHRYSIWVLVFEFWLSGLWILSLIFTSPDTEQMEQTNFWMFITLGFGSLVGGYASDRFGHMPIFKLGSIMWLLASILVLINMKLGYILAAGSIGLLNNLTFVIIMQMFKQNKDIYTIYVLIGWAVSQITLGLLFYVIEDREIYFIGLFCLTLGYVLGVFMVLGRDVDDRDQDLMPELIGENNINANDEQLQHNPQTNNPQQWWNRILPHSLKALLGGCILMFVMQMFYYRTQFTLDRFGISLQLNTIVVGCTQLSANLIFTKIINRYSRNYFLRIFIIILAVLFSGLVITDNKLIQTIIEGIMRLFDTCIMIILGVYLPELFDRDQRGKGTNYVMSFGVLGSALNSVILNGLQFWQLVFFLLAGFLATFCFKEVTVSPDEATTHKKNQQYSQTP